MLILGIFIVSYIFEFKNYWFGIMRALPLFSFIIYIRWDKKHKNAFLNLMNKRDILPTLKGGGLNPYDTKKRQKGQK